MQWVKRNAIGILGLALAATALALGFFAHRSATQRDEQTRGIALRLQRDEAEMADRHRRGAAVLRDLTAALQTLTYSAAGAAVAAAAWDARGRAPLWRIGTTLALAAGGVALAAGARVEHAVG